MIHHIAICYLYCKCSPLHWYCLLFMCASCTFFLFQLEPGSAHLCLHHGISYHSLSTACFWASIQAYDTQIYGNGNQTVWHVHCWWTKRVRGFKSNFKCGSALIYWLIKGNLFVTVLQFKRWIQRLLLVSLSLLYFKFVVSQLKGHGMPYFSTD